MIKKYLKHMSIILAIVLTVYGFGMPILNAQYYVMAATTDYSWNNTIPEKYPDAGNDNGKLILFDNTHGETAGAADWVIDGGFSDFADALVADGYTVKEYRGVDINGDGVYRYYDDRQTANVAINESIITYDAIQDADVFVISEANRPLRTSEYAALKQFTDAGKGIFFISDHYNADRNKNTWDSTEVYNGYNRSTDSAYNLGGVYGDQRNPGIATEGWLAENYGLRFRFNAIDCMSGVSDVRSITDTEGITQGVNPILMAAGSTLAIVNRDIAKGIVYLSDNDSATKWSSAVDQGIYYGGEDEGPFVAISKPSAGKAAFIGDSSPIEDITPKYLKEETGATKTTYDGWNDSGNAAVLAVNIINWLATSESYVGFDGINHTKGITTPIPMASVETDEVDAEPWAQPSYDPWDTDTFDYGSYGAPTGPGGSSSEPGTGEGVYISEYIEGSSYNKGLEIFNGTDSAIDLSEYSLVQYNNGSSTATFTLNLSGTLAVGDVYVVVNANASSTMKVVADLETSNSVMSFNGDDAIALRHNDSDIDVIGKIGQDPGSEWGAGVTSTQDNTLVRKTTITAGDADGTDTFDPSVEWDGYAVDTFDYLGSHDGSTGGTNPTGQDLFISEYIEGSSYNKGLEIYNGTGSTVDLSEYTLSSYVNGSTTPLFTLDLSGSLANGEVFVVVNANASLTMKAVADLQTSNGIMDFNGDDAITLSYNGTIIDAIGKIGEDPGYEWGTGDTSTQNNTLVRKETITAGDADGTDTFDPSVEWDGYAVDTFDNLGSHTVVVQPLCTELFISEYIEGSGYNKGLEIYNGTGSDVDLSNYSLNNYSNGRTTPLYTLVLSGTLASGEVYVVVNANAASTMKNVADLQTSNGIMDFNGDDAIVLMKNGVAIDVIGKLGEDPGSEWGAGVTSTQDNTLVRKSTVTEGDADGSDSFDPSVEWDGYAVDTFNYLGSY